MTLMKRQSKVKAKSCQKVMNLDEYMPKDSIPRKKWLLGMGMKDKALIINRKWLNDNLVNAGQQLLVNKLPHLNGF